MQQQLRIACLTAAAAAIVSGCAGIETSGSSTAPRSQLVADSPAVDVDVRAKVDEYAKFRLEADLDDLSENQRRLIVKLIAAAEVMDDLFWRQAYGDDWPVFLDALDGTDRRLAEINYGPWDRLGGNEPFVAGVGVKPEGAAYYPADMSDAEFEAWNEPGKDGLYSLVRRDDAGELALVPYHEAYADGLAVAAERLREAADLADTDAFADYLRLRANALVTDDYQPSDLAWMDMKDNALDVIIGAIETYEDQRYGYRAGYEAYVLKKDLAWSRSLAHFATFLPALQQDLPVPDAYKTESPGTDSDLGAYDVLYYAGHSNAGSKTIAVNLPNDETVQLTKGTRRLQLKNAMRAKFEKILEPLADELITPEQRAHVTFDAFFANTMFHEVAHGLGIKKTINGKGTVRSALLDVSSSLEEGKADVLGLYMVTKLHEAGELGDASLMDNYVTFFASIFRSVRFGASSAHGKANMIRFNYFLDRGAFRRDDASGQYAVDFDAMQAAMNELSALILTIQGDGDYGGARELTDTLGVIRPQLAADLDRLSMLGIPVDIVFEQGVPVLGLQAMQARDGLSRGAF
ncbi:MAG: Zn-dependent hydrolase [Pseudomonadota bacterium]